MLDQTLLRQARQEFIQEGMSVADWARLHSFSLPLVYAVLNGRNHASRGESHKIAVALGVKKTVHQPRFTGVGSGSSSLGMTASKNPT
jgi:gp16 family phage-associated protein